MNHQERINEVDDEEIINEFLIMSLLSYLPRWVKPTLGGFLGAVFKEKRVEGLAKIAVLRESAPVL